MFDIYESYPPINVFETESDYYIIMFAPNVELSSLKIFYKENMITIVGKAYDPMDVSSEKRIYHIIEAKYGEFLRRVFIADDIEEDAIESKFNKGILIIKVPKKKPKEIDIDE